MILKGTLILALVFGIVLIVFGFWNEAAKIVWTGMLVLNTSSFLFIITLIKDLTDTDDQLISLVKQIRHGKT